MWKLIAAFIKSKGRKPNAIEMLKLKAQFREQSKILPFKHKKTFKKELEDMGKTEPTLDDLLKGHIDTRGRKWTFKKRTEGEVVPIQKGISDEAATGHVQKLKEELPFMSRKELHQLRADVVNRKAYGSFDDVQRRELLDALTNQFTNKPEFASGGIAGQLHLNRPGYQWGGPPGGGETAYGSGAATAVSTPGGGWERSRRSESERAEVTRAPDGAPSVIRKEPKRLSIPTPTPYQSPGDGWNPWTQNPNRQKYLNVLSKHDPKKFRAYTDNLWDKEYISGFTEEEEKLLEPYARGNIGQFYRDLHRENPEFYLEKGPLPRRGDPDRWGKRDPEYYWLAKGGLAQVLGV